MQKLNVNVKAQSKNIFPQVAKALTISPKIVLSYYLNHLRSIEQHFSSQSLLYIQNDVIIFIKL